MDDNAEKFGRALGAPKREGNRLFGRPIPDGDEGAAKPDGPGSLEFRAGEAGRAIFDIGDADLTVVAGDDGRANLDMPATEGLPGRGIPPMREVPAGEAGRPLPDCKRVIWEGGAVTSLGSAWLGPDTRRRRSSNCVLSLGDSGPTRDHTFSPTSAYPSLNSNVS